ncbi:hypothetical protein OF83DRAFT_188345 [Amylostereum chailletii]|nr:hypothetical protein OF83DRAFT_188345 [Amylostereum chailletii]
MAPVTLTFTQDNPCNTIIIDENGTALYEVVTDLANMNKPVTGVRDGHGKPIAEWVWRDGLRSDLLTFKGRPQISASAWLKKSLVPFNKSVTFADDQGREYKWDNNEPGLSLQLFLSESKKQPIARFTRAYKDFKASDHTPPVIPSRLLMDETAEEIMDEVVVSFLMLERRLRESTNEVTSRAAALALPAFSFSGTARQLIS